MNSVKRTGKDLLRHLPIWLVVALLLVAGRWHIVGLVNEDRARSISSAEREMINFGRLAEEHANRVFYSADQLLRAIRFQYLEQHGKVSLGPMMDSGAFDTRIFAQASIIDAQGILRYNSIPFTGRIDLSDREHFKVHVGAAKDELFISRPVLGRASGKWTIQFTRRITAKDGKFAGVVVVSLDPSYFTHFYNDLALGDSGVAALYRSDGWLFARKSANQASYESANTSAGPIFIQVGQGKLSGLSTFKSLVDGIERTYYFRKLHDHPAIVMIGFGTEEILARHEQAKSGLLQQAFAVSLFILGLGGFASFYIEAKRRSELAQRQSGEAFKQAAQYARGLIEASLDPLVTISAEGKITDVNTATEQVTGVGRIDLVGSDFVNYFTDPEKARQGYQQVFAKGFVTDYPLAIQHSSGTITDVLYNARVYRDDTGRVLGVFAAARDVTERKQVEMELHFSNQKLRSLLDSMAEGAYGADTNGLCTFVNNAFLRILGYATADQIIGKHIHEMIHHSHADGSHYPSSECLMYAAFRGQFVHRSDEVFWRLDGQAIPVEYWSQPIVVDGQLLGAIATFVDITERKQAEEKIHHLAFHDSLTSLPNRRLLIDRLSQAMVASGRSGRHGALLFLDLDNFKPLNDGQGHDAGDLLLLQVADRLKSCVRAIDTVARFGGDEFVVLLSELAADKAESKAEARIVAEKIRSKLAETYVLTLTGEGQADTTIEHRCSASVGVVVFIDHEAGQEELLRRADSAMYRAKEAGRNTIRFHEGKDKA